MTGIVRQPTDTSAPAAPSIDPTQGYTPNLSGLGTATTASPVDTSRGINSNNFQFQVFTGYQTQQRPGMFDNEPATPVTAPQFVSSDDMLFRLDGMAPNTAAAKELQQALFDAAYLPKSGLTGHIDDTTRSVYANMLQDVHAYNQQHPDQMMTPDQWLMASANASKALGGAGAGGGGESTSTSTSVNLSDPITASVMINKVMQSYEGRGASQAERAQFLAALNAYQSANPATSTTTVDRSSGMVVRSSTRDRSVSPDAFAQAYATSGKLGVEANTYKVATDYYDAAAKVLRAGGGR